MKKPMDELVQLAKEGDQEAIAALYEQSYNSVYQSVRAIIKDEDEALDIVQDSYIKGFQNLNKLGEPEKFQAWMKAIAANRARDYLRKKRPTLFSERIDEDGEEIDLRHQDDCLEHMPEEVIDRQETTRLMNDILATLSQEQRMAVVMYYYEEMSVREIAQELGCSENTVKSRLKYARSKIEVEVRKLEKKGTKLYSLAPMPFFTWLLRMAKEQGLAFTLDGVDAVLATGTAAAAAAGETATASATSGSAAAGAAAKAATSAAGKTVATKIVAGTLAATMTIGAGTFAINYANREKDNEKAHVIYEEFLDRYQDAFEMDGESFRLEYDRFWNEVSADILEQNPEIDLSRTNSWRLNYTSGYFFEEGILVPHTAYDPNMDSVKLLEKEIEDEEIRYAYYDINSDGIDEMFVAKFYRGDLQEYNIAVYAVEDGKILRGKVHCMFDGELHTWGFTDSEVAEYVDPGIVYIRMGAGFYDNVPDIEKPECDWELLYEGAQEGFLGSIESDPSPESYSSMSEDEKYILIKNLEGTYRIYSSHEFGGFDIQFRPCHELDLSVINGNIVITDRGEPEDIAQMRQSYIDNLVAYREQVRSPLPTAEELDLLTIANLGTMKIPIQTVTMSDKYNELQFNPVSFSGGEQSYPMFTLLGISTTTESESNWTYLHLSNVDLDTRIPLLTKNGQVLAEESSLVFERQ